MPITLREAKQLRLGQILYHRLRKDAKGAPEKWRVNGKVKLWKRSPGKVRVPLKHGLYNHDYLDERIVEMRMLCLTEEEALGPQKCETCPYRKGCDRKVEDCRFNQ